MAYEKINADIVPEGFEVRPHFSSLEPDIKIAVMAGIRGEQGLKGDKGDKGDTGSTGLTGATGNGIYSIVQNADGTLTILMTDGTSYTTDPVKGEKGDKGDTGNTGATGNGIAAISFNQDYTLTITMTNGTSYTTESIRGAQGEQGEQGIQGNTGDTGNGIASAVLNSNYTLTLTFTDGTSYTTPSIRGAQGDTGATGATGATGNGIASITKTGTVGLVDTYTIAFTNGTTTTFTVTNGEDGAGQVESVNGKTGVVVLNSADVGALPSSTSIPSKTSDLTNDSGYITSAQAPVTSVNSQYGDVIILIPVKLSDLQNDTNFITAAQAPVQSVNGNTGAVTLSIPTNTNQLTNGAGFITSSALTSYLPLSAGSGKPLTGDLYLGTHDIHRTPKYYSAAQSASKSLSASNTKICGVTNVEAGTYYISATAHFAMTGGGNAYFNIYRATNNTNKIVYDNHYIKGGSSWVATSAFVSCNAGNAVSLYIEPSTSCSVDTVYLELVRF